MKPVTMAFGPTALPKMMIGFVVRRCTVEVGHKPSPEEFAAWANNYNDGDRTCSLFGRPISVDEARLILRHPARPVSARSAAPHECVAAADTLTGTRSATVISLPAVKARLKARGK
jgi:hypothetical protein